MDEKRQNLLTLLASWVGVFIAIAAVVDTGYQTRQSLALTRQQMAQEDQDREAALRPDLDLDSVATELPLKLVESFFVLEPEDPEVFALKNVGKGAAMKVTANWYVTQIERHSTPLKPPPARPFPPSPPSPPFLNNPLFDNHTPKTRTALSGDRVVFFGIPSGVVERLEPESTAIGFIVVRCVDADGGNYDCYFSFRLETSRVNDSVEAKIEIEKTRNVPDFGATGIL